MRGTALDLIKSYLGNRTQYVTYGGFESDRGPQECGVPQGSVLGPLFFLLYVNDMAKACKDLDLVLFADDTNIFAEGPDYNQLVLKVNKGLEQLSQWFKCNRLTLNLKKTEYMYFGCPGKRNPGSGTLMIGNEQIRKVESAKFLGVTIDDGLKWSTHIEKVKTKVSQLLGVVGRTRSALGGEAVLTLYNGLVLPHLQYCLIVWGDFEGARNLTIRAAMLRYQKKFAGMASGKSGRFHADPLFAKLGMLKIDDLYRQQLRVHAWQYWNKRLPEGQTGMFQRVSEVHGYSTRGAESGIALISRDKGSISYRVPREWSLLPEQVEQSSDYRCVLVCSSTAKCTNNCIFTCSFVLLLLRRTDGHTLL